MVESTSLRAQKALLTRYCNNLQRLEDDGEATLKNSHASARKVLQRAHDGVIEPAVNHKAGVRNSNKFHRCSWIVNRSTRRTRSAGARLHNYSAHEYGAGVITYYSNRSFLPESAITWRIIWRCIRNGLNKETQSGYAESLNLICQPFQS